MRRNKGFTLIELMIVIAIIAVIAAIAIPGLLQAQRASNERNASTSLKTISSGQADLRANDRDGNRVNDFWTGDVAGLYCAYNHIDQAASREEPIKMIELSVAAADAAPAGNGGAFTASANYSAQLSEFSNSSAKAGYWYIVLVTDNSVTPAVPYQIATNGVEPDGTAVDESSFHTSKFGVMAYPDSLSAGKSAFIVNESNTVYKQQMTQDCRDQTVAAPPGVPSAGGIQSSAGDNDWPSNEDLKSYWQKLD